MLLISSSLFYDVPIPHYQLKPNIIIQPKEGTLAQKNLNLKTTRIIQFT